VDTLLGLAGLDTSARAAVRRPVLTLSFVPAGTSGGIGGALSGAAAGLAAAGSTLGIGAGGSVDPWQRSVTAVVVEAGLAPFVDVASVTLSADTQAPPVNVGDEGSISLGYEDTPPATVFSGVVHSVRRDLRGTTRFTVTNGGATLARLRLIQSYEQQTAGEIIGNVVSRAGVQTDSVESGMDFPFFVIDDRRGAYTQLAALARRCGFAASFTADGKLRFGRPGSGNPVQTFNYGVDILSLALADAAPIVKTVTAIGDGAAGSQGQEAWSWLVKDPTTVSGAAGDGDPARVFPDPALRSQDAAQRAAAGIATEAGYLTLSGEVTTPGAPGVTAGAVIEIVGAPREAMNGRFLVHRVRHVYDKRKGFTTRMGFSKQGSGSGGFDPLAALGGLL
jgi:phage protein D